MLHEEVEPFVIAVRRRRIVAAAGGMVRARHHQQIEVLVVLDQLVHDLHRRRGIDVRIELADDEQQIALQPVRVVDVRRGRVLLADRPRHPQLVPPDLVHAVVVAAGVGDARLVEIRVKQQTAERVLPARRPAVDAHTGDVVRRILRRDRFVPEDPIGKAGIAKVFPGNVVKCL